MLKQRWGAWLAGYALILTWFGLAWWNNPANVGGINEAQRAWLALGYAAVGMLVLLPMLTVRHDHETGAQKTLIIVLAIWFAIAVWWVGYLPSDPFGCSRVEAPDCHTQPATRWRALAEVTGAYVASMLIAAWVHGWIERRRTARAAALSS